MDQSLLTLTQLNPANRLSFDMDKLDQSILRAEQRRANLRASWSFLTSMNKAAMVYVRSMVRLAAHPRLT